MRIPMNSIIIDSGGDLSILTSLKECIEQSVNSIMITCEPVTVYCRNIVVGKTSYNASTVQIISSKKAIVLTGKTPLEKKLEPILTCIRKMLENTNRTVVLCLSIKDSWANAFILEGEHLNEILLSTDNMEILRGICKDKHEECKEVGNER